MTEKDPRFDWRGAGLVVVFFFILAAAIAFGWKMGGREARSTPSANAPTAERCALDCRRYAEAEIHRFRRILSEYGTDGIELCGLGRDPEWSLDADAWESIYHAPTEQFPAQCRCFHWAHGPAVVLW